MSMNYKQKHSKVQELLNSVEVGGGGGDSYTKQESDVRYQKKSDMTNYWTADQTDGAIDTAIAGLNGKYVPIVTDETGTYFVSNGIRVYIASSAPTGDIPDGSIGVGW